MDEKECWGTIQTMPISFNLAACDDPIQKNKVKLLLHDQWKLLGERYEKEYSTKAENEFAGIVMDTNTKQWNAFGFEDDDDKNFYLIGDTVIDKKEKHQDWYQIFGPITKKEEENPFHLENWFEHYSMTSFIAITAWPYILKLLAPKDTLVLCRNMKAAKRFYSHVYQCEHSVVLHFSPLLQNVK